SSTIAPNTSIPPAYTRSRGRLAKNPPCAIRLSRNSCIEETGTRQEPLSIHFRGHDVEAGNHPHQVGDHQSAADFVDDAHRGKRPGAHLAAIRELAAVAHHIPSHVAARALDADIGVAGGRLELARHLGDHRPLGDLLEALAKNLAAL